MLCCCTHCQLPAVQEAPEVTIMRLQYLKPEAILQVRMEVSYRKHLYMPVAMEVHPVNDNAHGKLEAWAPDSEKMQAELEGNRVQKTLNVSLKDCYSLALA